MRPSVLLLPVAAAVFGLAGCSQETAGNARPDPTSEQASEPSEPSATTSEEAGSPLADVEPCGLLPAATVAELGFTEQTEAAFGQGRACRWRFEGATLADTFTVDLVLYDSLSVDDVNGTNISPTTIGGHDAVTFNDSTGGCIVSIAVGDESRVDSLATGGDVARGCELANRLAAAVEPELP